jgi:hypothetical protein
MRIHYSEIEGWIEIDGKKISADVLAQMADPTPRILWKFEHRDGVITALPYTETQVIWIDRSREPATKIEFGGVESRE